MITVQPYREEHVPAVQAFNRRLKAGGAPPEHRFPESATPRWLPKTPGATVFNEFFLALEDGVVRGTYALKTQAFAFGSDVRPIGYYHHPFSEGTVDRAYTMVGIQLLRDALRRKPETFALGMGGYDRPLPKMLIAMKWQHRLLPFYFQVARPARFLRGMRGLRSTPARRWAMDLAAFSGAGWLAVRGRQGWRARGSAVPGVSAEPVSTFGAWADTIWRAGQTQFAMTAVRDASTLNVLFPSDNPKFVRLRVYQHGATIGWAVVAERGDRDHPQTGDLRVGVILDVMAHPDHALPVVAEAASALRARGVDLITSNQSHPAWCRALERAGFLEGPSNFILAVPKTVSDRLPPVQTPQALAVHLTRADGDGLYQYI